MERYENDEGYLSLNKFLIEKLQPSLTPLQTGFLYALVCFSEKTIKWNNLESSKRFALLRLVCLHSEEAQIFQKNSQVSLSTEIIERIARQAIAERAIEWIYLAKALREDFVKKLYTKEYLPTQRISCNASRFKEILEIFLNFQHTFSLDDNLLQRVLRTLILACPTMRHFHSLEDIKLQKKVKKPKIDLVTSEKSEGDKDTPNKDSVKEIPTKEKEEEEETSLIPLFEVSEFKELIAKQVKLLFFELNFSEWKKYLEGLKKHWFYKELLLQVSEKLSKVMQCQDTDLLIFLIQEFLIYLDVPKHSLKLSQHLLQQEPNQIFHTSSLLYDLFESHPTKLEKKTMMEELFKPSLLKWVDQSFENERKDIFRWFQVLEKILSHKILLENKPCAQIFIERHSRFLSQFSHDQVFSAHFEILKSTTSKKSLLEHCLKRVDSMNTMAELTKCLRFLCQRKIEEDSPTEKIALSVLSHMLASESTKNIPLLSSAQASFWSFVLNEMSLTNTLTNSPNFSCLSKMVINFSKSLRDETISLTLLKQIRPLWNSIKPLFSKIEDMDTLFRNATGAYDLYTFRKENLKCFLETFCFGLVTDFEEAKTLLNNIYQEDKLNLNQIKSKQFYGPLSSYLSTSEKLSTFKDTKTVLNFYRHKTAGKQMNLAALCEFFPPFMEEFNAQANLLVDPNKTQSLDFISIFWKNIKQSELRYQIAAFEKITGKTISQLLRDALLSFCEYSDFLEISEALCSLSEQFELDSKKDYFFENLKSFISQAKNVKANIYELHNPLYNIRETLQLFLSKPAKNKFVLEFSKCIQLIPWLKKHCNDNLKAIFLSVDHLSDQ